MLKYLSKRNIDNKSGFTLVELIVVVVIIGILSSIAIPGFNNASDKAKQREASTLLASYAKAAQAYYTETSQVAASVAELNQYITVSACSASATTTQACKNSQVTVNTGTSWKSPTGMYNISMTTGNAGNGFTATPIWNGYAVTASFCTSTGSTILNDFTVKAQDANAPTIAAPNCP